MADFSFLSDSDDSAAVEELLSQAMDHSVLEQVAAINCSGISDSVLPTHLETRFRKLKSFPATKPKSPYLSTDRKSSSSSFNSHISSVKPQFENQLNNSVGAKTELDSLSDDENAIFSHSKENPDDKMGLKPNTRLGSASSPCKPSNSSIERAIFSPSKEYPDEKMGVKSKSRSGSFSSPSNSSMDSPSPPRKTGCFWCSPKRVSRKKSKENWVAGIGLDWGKNDEVLSDLSVFSSREQKRMLKKAMKEEEKVSREAEKIVKWAKQASARMNVTVIEDELSDNESIK